MLAMHRPCPHTCCRQRTGPGCEPRSRASGGLGAAWGSSASVCPDALPWGLGLGLITIFPPQSGRRGPRAPAPSSQSSAGLWRSLSRAFPGFSSRWRKVAGRRGSAHPGPGAALAQGCWSQLVRVRTFQRPFRGDPGGPGLPRVTRTLYAVCG